MNQVNDTDTQCCSGKCPNFKGTAARVLGIIQLAGAVAIVLIIIICLALKEYYEIRWFRTSIAFSILLYTPTGTLGVCSHSKSKGVVIAYLVMCILTAIGAYATTLLEGFTAAGSWFSVTITLHAFACVIAFTEFVVAITGFVLCCAGMSCGTQAAPSTMMNDTGESPNFNGKAGRILGTIQLAGAIATVFIIIILWGFQEYFGIIPSSIFLYILTGILGICSLNKSRGVVIAYLVMCILTAIGACATTCLEGWAAASVPRDSVFITTMHVTACVIAFTEFVVCITGFVFCCSGMGCDTRAAPSTMVVNTAPAKPTRFGGTDRTVNPWEGNLECRLSGGRDVRVASLSPGSDAEGMLHVCVSVCDNSTNDNF